MPTTMTDLVTDVKGLTLSTVARKFDGTPPSLNTADLPAAWVMNPSIEVAPFSRGATGNWPTVKCDLVVATGPAGQSTSGANFLAAVAMCDAIRAALESAEGTALSKAAPSATIKVAIAMVAGTEFWAAVASIEGQG